MKNKLIYLFVLLLTLFIAIVSPYEFPVFRLAFELIFLAVLLLFPIYLSRKIKISLQVPSLTVPKQEPILIEIKIENTSRLPVANVAVGISYIDGFDKTEISERTLGMVDSRSTVILRLKITARYAGKVSFRLDQAKIYDYLKLSGWRVKVDKDLIEALVVPDMYEIRLDLDNMTMRLGEEGDFHSHERSGDDVSEVFDTRAFRDGDTLQKIHWKLSAKADELLVREFSMPIENMVLLLVDLQWSGTQKWTHMQSDGMLTMIASVSYSLLVQGCPHEVAWLNGSLDEFIRLPITSEEDIYELAGSLMDAGVYEDQCDLEDAYMESYSLGSSSKVLKVDTHWNLYLEGVCVASLADKDIGKALPELFIGV